MTPITGVYCASDFPVTDRELRVALLRRGARKRWMGTIWNAATLTFVIALLAAFSPDRGSGRTLFFILWAVWLRDFPAGNGAEVVVISVVLILSTLACFHMAGKVREKLEHKLHAIACAPIPAPGDARFKGWDPDRIIPPGRWGDFVLGPGGPQGRTRLPT